MSETSAFGAFNPGAFNPFQMYFGNLDTMAQSMSPMMGPMRAIARAQLETMGLMSRRTQAYMEIPSRLSRCRSPQDLIAEQTRFYQTAFQQYQESSKRIIEAWSQVTPAAYTTGSGTERDYISFADPREANGHARSARDRHAA